MNQQKKIKLRKKLRTRRTRAKIRGTHECPRLSVFRSLKSIYCQLIDDQAGKTLASASEKELPNKKGLNKSELAKAVGLLIANKAKDKKIRKVVFDRGGYAYHGRVKALADGAREGGLKF